MVRLRHCLNRPWPLLATLMLATVLAACTPARDDSAAIPTNRLPKDMLVRLVDGEPRSLDPASVSDNNSTIVARDQFEGLMRLDGAAHPQAGLAQSWRTSTDGLTWQFTLRQGLRFSDGTPIDAQTVVASIERLRNPETAYSNGPLAEPIRSMAALDALRIEIKLKAPFPQLPELLAHPAFATLPMHRIQARGDAWTQDRPLVTSGPYRLTRWALGNGVILERNPHYHAHADVAIARVHWIGLEDKESALRRFRTGQAHLMNSLPSARVAQWRDRPQTPLRVAPYRGTYYWVFNQKVKPFDDVRVRRALQMTVEPALITEKLLNDGTKPAWTLVPPGVSGHVPRPPQWQNWPRAKRLAVARALLKEAGYGPGRPLKFEARFNSDGDHRRIALALGQFWKPLGVELTPYNYESAIHFSNLRLHQFSFVRSGWIADVDAPENFLYLHRSGSNELNYGNNDDPIFDALLDKALAEADPKRRAEMMHAAEARLIAQAIAVPIYFYVSKNMVSPLVIGWQDNLADIHPSMTLKLHEQ